MTTPDTPPTLSPDVSGARPASPPYGTASPNLQIILHWLLSVLIVVAVWYAALRTHDLSVWVAVGISAVIGGWVPVAMVLQYLRPPGSPATLPPTPPPTLAILAALAGGATLLMRGGSSGRTRGDVLSFVGLLAALFGLLAMLTVGVTVLLGSGCTPVRNGIMAVTPGVPPNDHCMAPASRCANGVPEVCSVGGRWWPATPAGAVCPYGCVEDPGADGGAYCAAEDGGAR